MSSPIRPEDREVQVSSSGIVVEPLIPGLILAFYAIIRF
jgi:hypothetical protein